MRRRAMATAPKQELEFDYSKYGFRDEEHYAYRAEKGLNEQVVRTLSRMKGEPEWMLKRRLKALEIYFSKPVPTTGNWANAKLAEADNKYAALNTAVWSGGSFVYVPQGVKVDIPLQAYFRINAENMGQFERTLII